MKNAGRKTKNIAVPRLIMAQLEKAATPMANEKAVDRIMKEMNLSDEAKAKIKVALRSLMEVGAEFKDTALADAVNQLASMAAGVDPTIMMPAEPPPPAEEETVMAAEEEEPDGDEGESEVVVVQEGDGEDEEIAAAEDAEDEVVAAEGDEDETEKETVGDEEEPMPKDATKSGKAAANKSADALALITKAHKETLSKLEKLQGEHDALAVKYAASETAQRMGALTQKAEREMRRIGKAEDIAAIILKVEDGCGAKVAEQVATLIKQANTLVEQSENSVFKEIGRDVPQEGNDAYGKLETMAAVLVEKSNHAITPAIAMTEILKTAEGKRLYAEYRANRQ